MNYMFEAGIEYGDCLIEVSANSLKEFVTNLNRCLPIKDYNRRLCAMRYCTISSPKKKRHFTLVSCQTENVPCDLFGTVEVSAILKKGYYNFAELMMDYVSNSSAKDIEILEF